MSKIKTAKDLNSYCCKELDLDIVLNVWLSLEGRSVEAGLKNPTSAKHNLDIRNEQLTLIFNFNQREAEELDTIFLGKVFDYTRKVVKGQPLYAYPKSNTVTDLRHMSRIKDFTVSPADLTQGVILYKESVQRIFREDMIPEEYKEELWDYRYKLIANTPGNCKIAVTPKLKHQDLMFVNNTITFMNYVKRGDEDIENLEINFYGKRGNASVVVSLEGQPDQLERGTVTFNGKNVNGVESLPIEQNGKVERIPLDILSSMAIRDSTTRVLKFKNVTKVREKVLNL